MFRSIAARALWLTKGAALFGGAVVTLALVLGVGTMALAAVPGDPFRLGQTNDIDNISTLVGNVATPILRIDNEGSGTALDLRVESGEAPMKVNSTKRVNDLNADQVDGKSVANIRVNGQQIVRDQSDRNSNRYKIAYAICPEGKVVVGTGYLIEGAPYQDGSVVVTQVDTWWATRMAIPTGRICDRGGGEAGRWCLERGGRGDLRQDGYPLASAPLGRGSGSIGCVAPPIHPPSGKGYSANFVGTAF